MGESVPYFSKYEHRRPPAPLQNNPLIHSIGQICLLIAIVTGAWYLQWRWTSSLNFDALWFSIPLVLAESCAYIGLLLYVFNIWHVADTDKKPAPACISECHPKTDKPNDDCSVVKRPVSVDVFFPTYDEDESLVRLSLEDANKITYPHDIDCLLYTSPSPRD